MKAALLALALGVPDVDVDRIRTTIAIEIALRQIVQDEQPAEDVEAADDYQQAYDKALAAGLSLVVGIDLAPPKGLDWVGVRVPGPWHGERSGLVISSPPVDGHLLWITSLPSGAGFDEIMDTLSDWRGRQVIQKLKKPVGKVRQQVENC